MANRSVSAAASPAGEGSPVGFVDVAGELEYVDRVLAEGDVLAAIAACDALVAKGEGGLEVRIRFAGALRGNGEIGRALHEYGTALEQDPNNSMIWTELGNTLIDADSPKDGAAVLERAVELAPNSSPAMLGLLRAYRHLGETVRGEAVVERMEATAAAAPEDAAHQVYLGLGYSQVQRHADALQALRRACELQPNNPFILHLCAVMLEEEGRTEEAIKLFETALSMAPNDAEIRFSMATALLRLGEMERGFSEYEGRWRNANFPSPRRSFPQPMWDGSPLKGKRILLHTEQGLGDSIQFIRYAEKAAALGGYVILECEEALERLLGRCEGIHEVVLKGSELPSFDVHSPLMSLPYLLGSGLNDIPVRMPYLRPPPQQKPLPTRGAEPRLRVGIAWEGSRTGANYLNKSTTFERFAWLADVPGVEVYSLQKGEGIAQLQTHPAASKVHDLGSSFSNFDETAAAVMQLDLVLTVDTAIAHLAGGLGKPCWILLSCDSDWRWLLDRDDSPWYPSVRLFRQASPRDWDSAFSAVRQALRELLTTPKKPMKRLSLHAPSAEAKRLFDEAVSFHTAQQMEKAESAYRKVLQLEPDDPEAHSNYGAVLCTLGKLDEGERHFRRAIELRPDYTEAHNNLGLLLVARRKLPEAIHHFQRAVDLDPEARDPLRNLSVSLREAGNPADSESVLVRALKKNPDDFQLLGMMACAIAERGQKDRAEVVARRTLELAPRNYDALIVLGNCAIERLEVNEALEFYDRAEAIHPTESSAQWNRSYVHLLRGEMEKGWKDYEERWKLLRVSAGDMEQYHRHPRWDGSSLNGKSILLHAEQGFGDTIQFVRYAAVLKERWDVRVVVQAQPPLVELLRTCPGVDEVVTRDDEPPVTDFQAPLLGLPFLLGTKVIEDIPAPGSYLTAVSTGIEELVGGPGELRVGIAWAGNPNHGRDAKRSLHLSALEHLVDLPGVQLYSLQIGEQMHELATARYWDRIIDLGSAIRDRQGGFSDTAAAIAALDLVITVDTSVAHLAGALGKPVWLLVPYLPDWRWLLERADSPWYPSMRIFRQPRPGDWAAVIAQVTRDLEERTGRVPREPETVSVKSVQKGQNEQPRFIVSVPLTALSEPRRFAEIEAELAAGGAHAEARAFLDSKLTHNDLLIDVDAGLGFVSLAAATAPGGRTRTIATVTDAKDARLLLNILAANELVGSVNVHLVPGGSPPLDSIATRPLTEVTGNVFLRIGSPSESAGAIAGAAKMIEHGRVAGIIWTVREGSQTDRIVLDTLTALEFSHFQVMPTVDGPELFPHEEGGPIGAIVSLSRRYLDAELKHQGEERAEISAPAGIPASAGGSNRHTADRPLAIDWQVSPTSGWGVYGMNLTLHCLRSERAFPVLLSEPSNLGLTAEQERELEPAFEAHRKVTEMMRSRAGETFKFHGTLLRALGNGLAATSVAEAITPRDSVGVVFFEDTNLDSGALQRGRHYSHILAGSTWNAELLRARGLDHVSVCLQGVDTTLFRPGNGDPLVQGRFVVFSGGKLEYRKGQDIVVAAFREFHRRHPDTLLVTAWHNHWPEAMAGIDARGHVVGVPEVDSVGRLDVERWLHRNGLPKDSYLDLGLVPNSTIADVIRGVDLAVFPNRCEGGTNLVAMECMASGVPVVLSSNTGHLDLVSADRCYSLTQQHTVLPYRFYRGLDGWGESSVEELVEQMECAYTDREDARRRGAAAAEFIRGFSWDRQIARLLDTLDGLGLGTAEAA